LKRLQLFGLPKSSVDLTNVKVGGVMTYARALVEKPLIHPTTLEVGVLSGTFIDSLMRGYF
jgi:hypothetical protein